MKFVIVENIHASDCYHEVHKANCKDLNKKSQFVWDGEFDSLEEVKEHYEAGNDQFEDGGYIFEEHCKVFPCAKEKG